MANAIDNFNVLTGPQKAAILLMSLQEEYVSKIFSLLDDEEVREISVVMAGLGTVSSNTVEKLFLEFANEISNPGKMVGNYENTERLLMKALRDYTDIRQLTPEIVNALIRRIEVHSKDKETKKVKVDIYFTAVGLFTLPTEKEMQAAMEEIRQNPQQFKLSA